MYSPYSLYCLFSLKYASPLAPDPIRVQSLCLLSILHQQKQYDGNIYLSIYRIIQLEINPYIGAIISKWKYLLLLKLQRQKLRNIRNQSCMILSNSIFFIKYDFLNLTFYYISFKYHYTIKIQIYYVKLSSEFLYFFNQNCQMFIIKIN